MKKLRFEKLLLVVAFFTSGFSFAQYDFNFTSDTESFSLGGQAVLSASEGNLVLSLNSDNTNSTVEVRKSSIDLGDPALLTRVIVDVESHTTNADKIIIRAGSVNVSNSQDLLPGTQTYNFDIPTSSNWIGVKQVRVRFFNSEGTSLTALGVVKINRIQIIEPETLSSTKTIFAENTTKIYTDKRNIIVENLPFGALVNVFDITGAKTKLTNLPVGIYVVNIIINKQLISKKVVIE